MLRMRGAQRGFTLTELLVASGLAVAVAISIATMEGSRTQMQEELIRRTMGVGETALATVQLSERIAQADWLTIDNGAGVFRFRVPSGCLTAACLDNPASYRWDQYRLTGGELWLYTNTGAGCGAGRLLARNVTGLTLTPTAGNEVSYVLRWGSGAVPPSAYEFRGLVASRALASPPAGPLSPAPPTPGVPGAC